MSNIANLRAAEIPAKPAPMIKISVEEEDVGGELIAGTVKSESGQIPKIFKQRLQPQIWEANNWHNYPAIRVPDTQLRAHQCHVACVIP